MIFFILQGSNISLAYSLSGAEISPRVIEKCFLVDVV